MTDTKTRLDARVFTEAADYLEREGLTKGAFCKGKRRCALGALYEGYAAVHPGINLWEEPDEEGFIWATEEAADLVWRYGEALGRTIGLQYSAYVPEWNDDPKRRRAQVVAALRKTADRINEENASE